ncbi:WecB/TagA/CpsF family glycosyltransferase [Vagococcus fluvialis]|uniref:WecB/TagA/CpsF family glycosyltransferase n=1 Tax=Vagococcus fluvialis TaxID=2738 RepID=UPI0020336BAE|nr:WecB/TagA/CpsF family glycosyltransferase [Vagococcus fluvialis]MCM2138027.1 WecB/TagA/CpsF family glycosyltransferase [Vagococcus fluvialis]
MEQSEKILDVPVDLITVSDIISDIPNYVNQQKKMTLTSINPQILLVAQKNQQVKRFLVESTHRFADGIGVVKVSKWTKGRIKTRVPGIEVMEQVLKYAAENQLSTYFYGAKSEVVEQAISNFKKEYQNLIVAGYTDGYTKKSESELVNEINEKKTDILFVALGSPKQEEWLEKNMPHLNCLIFQTIGGSLDVKSGFTKRAPDVWIKLNLEWVYRSFSNPKRLYRILQVPEFVFKSLLWRLKHKES